MITKNRTVLVFDLDDTLYKEIDFLKSAYKEIAFFLTKKNKVSFDLIYTGMIGFYYNNLNVFDEVLKKHAVKDISVEDLIEIYRNHKPQIHLMESLEDFLLKLKGKVFKVGLITDGRTFQQKNKIYALGLSDYFDDIIISEEFGSEKPDIKNYKYFEDKYGEEINYIYVGDNTNKDFIAPNKLGWQTLCLLDNGNNIHKQSFDLDENKKPKFVIDSLLEIELFLERTK